jgi:putative ABC transport system permease protein
MLENYFKITLRNLGRNIFYVLINIIGMGLALAVCIVAYLNNKYDADFDKYNSNAKKIFKIESERPIQERQQWYGITPYSLGPLVKNDISAVEEVVRVQMSNSPVKVGEKNFSKRIAWCDPNFFKVFTIKLFCHSNRLFYFQQ